MNFRITARVVTQLGAELISSDEVAIYELVKNGFDAGSQTVEVNVSYRLSQNAIASLQRIVLQYEQSAEDLPKDLYAALAELLDSLRKSPSAQFCLLTDEQLSSLFEQLSAKKTTRDLLRHIGRVNTIDIVDYGRGMSADDVERYFLTIGTTHRLKELEALQAGGQKGVIPYGEKGIGRLSAMRLGSDLSLFTVPSYAEEAVLLQIYWRDFLLAREQDLGAVPIESERSPKGKAKSGTVLTISDLVSGWDRPKVEELGTNHLAKFIDPFPLSRFATDDQATQKRNVILRWNGELIQFLELIRVFLENANNAVHCALQFTPDGVAKLTTEFHFGASQTRPPKIYARTFSSIDFSGVSDDQLRKIGPFEFQLYHFPRNRLKAIPQIATRQEVKRWLDKWCGGLMVFRDGVRVMPYGNADDDWLGLDSKALRGHGFRVNRIQVVGCVRISRLGNPNLIDQTNREGLRDNDAFQAFRGIIQRHVQENFVTLLDQHLSTEKPEPHGLAHAMREKSDALSSSIKSLSSAIKESDWATVREVKEALGATVSGIAELHETVENLLEEKEGKRLDIIELAATGMTAEAMAHDLEGLIEGAVASLNELSKSQSPQLVGTIRHIRSVHKSLLTQVKQLSPGPARARRRASTFDLRELVCDIRSFYSERCVRHGIDFVAPESSSELRITAVNGHVRQVLDNLIRNAIFWLVDTRTKLPDRELRVSVSIDPAARVLSLTDTGVGIAQEDAAWIFEPFTSRRESGRGLGLYICRELCEFNAIHLRLTSDSANRWGRLNTFTLEFPPSK